MQRQAENLTLSIGEKAPYFSLTATDGRIYTISDFSNSKATLIVFTCNHCPYAQAYEKRLCKIAKDYKEKGLAVVAICSNNPDAYPEDSFEQMKLKSKLLGFPFPYLQDRNQIVASAYDALCTPETYLFDSAMKLAYHGWIDDNVENPELVKSPDLINAIESVLDNKTPTKQLTAVIGCSIKYENR